MQTLLCKQAIPQVTYSRHLRQRMAQLESKTAKTKTNSNLSLTPSSHFSSSFFPSDDRLTEKEIYIHPVVFHTSKYKKIKCLLEVCMKAQMSLITDTL